MFLQFRAVHCHVALWAMSMLLFSSLAEELFASGTAPVGPHAAHHVHIVRGWRNVRQTAQSEGNKQWNARKSDKTSCSVYKNIQVMEPAEENNATATLGVKKKVTNFGTVWHSGRAALLHD